MTYAPLIAAVLLTLADILTTRAALRRGAREGNPILRWAMQFGSVWMLLKVAITAAGVVPFYLIEEKVWLIPNEQWAWAPLAVIAWAAWSNTKRARQ